MSGIIVPDADLQHGLTVGFVHVVNKTPESDVILHKILHDSPHHILEFIVIYEEIASDGCS